jgi:hypothetical protein
MDVTRLAVAGILIVVTHLASSCSETGAAGRSALAHA